MKQIFQSFFWLKCFMCLQLLYPLINKREGKCILLIWGWIIGLFEHFQSRFFPPLVHSLCFWYKAGKHKPSIYNVQKIVFYIFSCSAKLTWAQRGPEVQRWAFQAAVNWNHQQQLGWCHKSPWERRDGKLPAVWPVERGCLPHERTWSSDPYHYVCRKIINIHFRRAVQYYLNRIIKLI